MATSKPSSQVIKADGAKGKRFGLAVSRYHEELTRTLQSGAENRLLELGARKEDLFTVWVPGSFELPLAARSLAAQNFDAVIALGIIIKGETSHNDYIAREAARGLSAVAQSAGIPVVFGVLTTNDLAQAKARCGGEQGHKGIESADAAVAMIDVLDQIKKAGDRPSKSMGFGA